MKQNLKKQTMMAGLLFCSLGLVNGCASLSSSDAQVIPQEQPVVYQNAPTGIDPNICSPENPSACIVSYEEPDLRLAQIQNTSPALASMAVSTNASYVVDMAPISISVPMIEQGLSVKEKMAQKELEKQRALAEEQRLLAEQQHQMALAQQKELEQQQKDLALQPVSNADIVCNGDECNKELFKTEVEKEIQTTVTKEKTYRELTLSDKIAYGEENHDWEATAGDTMKKLLTQWGKDSGWTVVWKIDRDYKLEAGVVFRGKFTEVAAAFIRSFARATPAPIGTFYKGNRVLVISAQENENAD